MQMDYEMIRSGAMEEYPFSLKYTMAVLKRHSADQAEFLDTFGFHTHYSPKATLEWLGY